MSWFSAWPPGGVGGLDPGVRAALDAQGPVPEYRSKPLAELRAFFEQLTVRLPKLGEPLARVEDRTIAGGVRARLYTPEGREPFPILLYFHGGGWVLGDLESHDDVCRSLARRAGARVVSIDYRRSPETRFPGALDDAEAALRWAAGQAREVAVSGDSAGANLAAALALRIRDRGGPKISSQLLIYPATGIDFETASYREFAAGFGLTRDNMRWFWECYLKDAQDGDDPHAVPLKARDLGGLPRAFVLTAECDVLRDEGEAYAARLHAAGVPVRAVRYLGMNHGFIRMGALFPQADRALSDLAAALRE